MNYGRLLSTGTMGVWRTIVVHTPNKPNHGIVVRFVAQSELQGFRIVWCMGKLNGTVHGSNRGQH